MVERRHWFSDLVPHIIMVLGVLLMAFPVWVAFVGSTWDAGTIAKLKTKVAEFEAKSAPVLANEETLPSVNWDKMAKDASGA